jgi:hypothetical protein
MQDEKIFWTVIGIVVLFAVIYFQEINSKSRVKAHLEQMGFQEIAVQTKLFAGGKGTLTFEVGYINRNGEAQKNTCIVHTGLFSEDTIYWKSPLH